MHAACELDVVFPSAQVGGVIDADHASTLGACESLCKISETVAV